MKLESKLKGKLKSREFYIVVCFMFVVQLPLSYGQLDSMRAFSYAEIAGGFKIGSPMGYWKEVGDRTLTGYTISFGTPISNRQFVFAGIDYGVTNLGSSVMKDVLIDIELYDIETTSKFSDVSVYGRYEFDQYWYLIPYISVNSGVRIATTKTDYTLVEFPDNEDTEREHRDVSLVNSLSIGLKLPLTESFSVNVMGQYFISTELEYDILDNSNTSTATHPLENFRLLETYPKQWMIGMEISFKIL